MGLVSRAGAMDVPAVLAAIGGGAGEPSVLVRLFLMAADPVTGEPRLVSTFVKRLAMASAVLGPGGDVTLDIAGERRVFTPASVVWDEAHRVCIVEIAWVVPDEVAAVRADRARPS